MLYTQAKQYLLRKLKEAGLRSNPYTTVKGLKKTMESHVGAVLFEQETYARNGSKRQFKDQEGARHKRRKVLDRDVTFEVVIGDYTDEAVEAMLEAFLRGLDDGIDVDGSYVPIEVEEAQWKDEDDTVLRAKVAVNVSVTFRGGVYRETDFAPVTAVEVVSVEKDKGKEPDNGD